MYCEPSSALVGSPLRPLPPPPPAPVPSSSDKTLESGPRSPPLIMRAPAPEESPPADDDRAVELLVEAVDTARDRFDALDCREDMPVMTKREGRWFRYVVFVINKSQVLQCCRQSGPASTPLLLFGKRAVLRQRQRRAQV